MTNETQVTPTPNVLVLSDEVLCEIAAVVGNTVVNPFVMDTNPDLISEQHRLSGLLWKGQSDPWDVVKAIITYLSAKYPPEEKKDG